MPKEVGMPTVKNHFVHILTSEQEELIINCINTEIDIWKNHTDIPEIYIQRLRDIIKEMQDHSKLSYRSL